MRTGYHKIGIGAATIMLLQRLTLPVASVATLYTSIYVFGISPTDENAMQYLVLGVIWWLLVERHGRPTLLGAAVLAFPIGGFAGTSVSLLFTL